MGLMQFPSQQLKRFNFIPSYSCSQVPETSPGLCRHLLFPSYIFVTSKRDSSANKDLTQRLKNFNINLKKQIAIPFNKANVMVLPKGLKNYTIPKSETFIHKKTCVE